MTNTIRARSRANGELKVVVSQFPEILSEDRLKGLELLRGVIRHLWSMQQDLQSLFWLVVVDGFLMICTVLWDPLPDRQASFREL